MGWISKATPGAQVSPAPSDPTIAAEELAAMAAAARAEANRERREAKDAAIVLARKMAEKIVGHAVEIDPGVMRDIAAQALAAAKPGQAAVRLRLHPDDWARLQGERPGWSTEMQDLADVHMVADASVARYGCVVETATARLDARLETQLDFLERAVRASGRGRG